MIATHATQISRLIAEHVLQVENAKAGGETFASEGGPKPAIGPRRPVSPKMNSGKYNKSDRVEALDTPKLERLAILKLDDGLRHDG